MRLAVSFVGEKNRIFWTYGSKVMDVWSFEEKYGQGGHVLEPTSKSWLHQPKKVGSRNKGNLEKSPLRVSSPIFWTLPLHLGGWNLPSLMEHGDFIFFQILFLLNLEYTWTLISTVGILVSWKNEITKNSTRIASVMEIFFTLLQCRVDLSMFHSSSTSNIWRTST
jgi:hypothetical protein